MATEVAVDNGKYTFIVGDEGQVSCLRDGVQWITEFERGGKALIALIHKAAEPETLTEALTRLSGPEQVKFDVCWNAGYGDGSECRVVGVEMAELPRRGDAVDLEGVDDERFWQAFPKGEEVYNVNCLVVEMVIHRSSPNKVAALIHAETGVGCIEVWVTAPGVEVCSHCGHEV